MSLLTIAVYQFAPLKELPVLRDEIKERCLGWGFKGTVLLAPEGINCFLAGYPQQISEFKGYLVDELGFKNLSYKENVCDDPPFTRLLVKIKKEIISMGLPHINPIESTAPYLSPQELKAWLDQKKDIVLLDTRNDYEISVGTFKNAEHLNLNSFKGFVKASEQLPEELKEKTVVMFCTGGIRCEKASALFIERGFKDVYQLEGGILRYFEECKDAHFDGNCFVFDWRLAVNSELKPVNRSERDPINAGRHQMKKISIS
jgi:predicted sulfurtransferase